MAKTQYLVVCAISSQLTREPVARLQNATIRFSPSDYQREALVPKRAVKLNALRGAGCSCSGATSRSARLGTLTGSALPSCDTLDLRVCRTTTNIPSRRHRANLHARVVRRAVSLTPDIPATALSPPAALATRLHSHHGCSQAPAGD